MEQIWGDEEDESQFNVGGVTAESFQESVWVSVGTKRLNNDFKPQTVKTRSCSQDQSSLHTEWCCEEITVYVNWLFGQ